MFRIEDPVPPPPARPFPSKANGYKPNVGVPQKRVPQKRVPHVNKAQGLVAPGKFDAHTEEYILFRGGGGGGEQQQQQQQLRAALREYANVEDLRHVQRERGAGGFPVFFVFSRCRRRREGWGGGVSAFEGGTSWGRCRCFERRAKSSVLYGRESKTSGKGLAFVPARRGLEAMLFRLPR